MIVSQVTQGHERPLVDEGYFTSLYNSAWNLLTATATALPLQLVLLTLSMKLYPGDKPYLGSWGQLAGGMEVGKHKCYILF